MARRGENIYKRRDGRWEGRYIKGHRLGGKTDYGYVYARKYKECREKLDRAKAQYGSRQKAVKRCGKGLVSEFMVYWLFSIIQPYVKVSTFSNYAAIVEKWIQPFLGNKKLDSLGKEDVQNFIGILSKRGLSAGTVRNIYHVLSAAMKKAREYSYIYANPCEGICLPKDRKKEARILSKQEQKQLEGAIKGDKSELPILLAVYMGLRIGEICALAWDDVDIENSMLYVSRTAQRIQSVAPDAATRTVLVTGSAKSGCSARAIPLPAGIRKLFQKHYKTASGKYVFSYRSHQLEPRLLQYRFKILLKKAGLGEINFHALRHTFATRCIELSIDVKTLSELMGHASAKMTLDRYGHSGVEQRRWAMSTIDRLFACSA